MNKNYIRIGIFSIEDVLSDIGPFWRNFDGKKVKMGSQRYELFKNKGITCVNCGLEGKFFALEKHKSKNDDIEDNISDSGYHFNLYGYNDEGKEVMLTKDHIIPKSKDGENMLSNYQTMCYYCNHKKGNSL